VTDVPLSYVPSMVGTTVEPVISPSDTEGLATRVAVLKAAADPTRLRVLDLLADGSEHCHCELEETLEVPANRLSFHLKVLRDAGLVDTRRHGRWVHYHARPDALTALHAVLPRRVGAEDGPACCDRGSDES
jgi:ArsR family transcriptional regulator, arsenate/arsenite/antimonite-responsive transcriptional repressor